MRWQEPDEIDKPRASTEVVDVAFRMHCPRLPVDHAYALLRSVEAILPWFSEDPRIGIHSIHGAESSHGWYRPAAESGQHIQLSKRVRLVLRVPLRRVEQCAELNGRRLNVLGHEVDLGNYKIRAINPVPNLFARHVITGETESEEQFVDRVHRDLVALGTAVPKLLPGRCHTINTPTTRLRARSLLLADVPMQDSVLIQESGLGDGRSLGCGLFIPHKSVAPVER